MPFKKVALVVALLQWSRLIKFLSREKAHTRTTFFCHRGLKVRGQRLQNTKKKKKKKKKKKRPQIQVKYSKQFSSFARVDNKIILFSF